MTLDCLPDKNECKQFGMCSHICNNTKGSYKCSCHKYFTRINDTCKADSKSFYLNLTIYASVCCVLIGAHNFPCAPQLTGKCFILLMTTRSAAWTPQCQTGATSRSSRVMPMCALMPWTCMLRQIAFTGQTGTQAAFLPMICLLPPRPPIATVTDAKVTPGSPTWR